jgi:hypothetical protein
LLEECFLVVIFWGQVLLRVRLRVLVRLRERLRVLGLLLARVV